MKKQFYVLGLPLLVLVLAYVSATAALSCVQCHNCPANYTEATECPDNYDALCLKIFHKIAKNPKKPVIDRTCSNSTSTETLCSDMTGITSCLYYCSENGCNAAIPTAAKTEGWLLGLMTVVSYIVGVRNAE